MAVEARHLNLFPSQIISNSEIILNGVESHGNVFGAPIGYGTVAPSSGTTAMETFIPMYSSGFAGTTPRKTAAMRSESGLTYAVPVSRKRSRDVINPLLLSSFPLNQTTNNRSGSFTFLGEDISNHIQQQQTEIDRFIAQHTENLRIEIEERRRRYSRRIAAAVEENVMKKMKSREDEIQKIEKLNWMMEEKVKSLCVENQLWRDLAQNNEATANALRSNLEQVLAQANVDAAVTDDAQSCCGSNFEEMDQRTLVECASNSKRLCRRCGKEESCVLLLPCRHLCLCTVCGSSLHTCPVCHSTKTASVHVNFS